MRFLSLSAFTGAALASLQTPLGSSSHSIDGSASDFHLFQSDVSANHFVRIKKQSTSLCNTPVNQYTGWLDNGPKHLFFWYFESQSAPASEDALPLTVWMNGGPGASSMLGLFQELGPCLINEHGNGTVYNPYGWNKDTALLVVDQPPGTGFSYLDEDAEPIIGTSYASAEDMQIFLQTFTSTVFPSHLGGPLVLSGESYGGHYLPTLGAQIVRQNILYPRRPQLNLKSVAIGNAYVAPIDVAFGYWETLCSTLPGVPEPIFNETRCDTIAENLPRCMDVWTTCLKHPDPAMCRTANQICWDGVISLYDSESTGGVGSRNRYDITKRCDTENSLCYKQSELVERYLNEELVFESLGVPPEISKFVLSSPTVNHAFALTSDGPSSMVAEIQFLLASQIDVLIYSGNLDLACNTAGAKRWMNAMPWKGQAEFSSKSLQPWKSTVAGEEKVVGEFKEVNIAMWQGDPKKTRLSFVTIDNSGHLVPQDQPEVALDMLTRWLSGGSFA